MFGQRQPQFRNSISTFSSTSAFGSTRAYGQSTTAPATYAQPPKTTFSTPKSTLRSNLTIGGPSNTPIFGSDPFSVNISSGSNTFGSFGQSSSSTTPFGGGFSFEVSPSRPIPSSNIANSFIFGQQPPTTRNNHFGGTIPSTNTYGFNQNLQQNLFGPAQSNYDSFTETPNPFGYSNTSAPSFQENSRGLEIKSNNGYQQFKDPHTGKWEYVHRRVGEKKA